MLPVIAKRPYEVRMEVYIPEYALEPNAGVYLGGKRIIAFKKPGLSELTGQIPASETDKVILEIRCRGWVPKDTVPGSTDPRTLGVAVRSVSVKAK